MALRQQAPRALQLLLVQRPAAAGRAVGLQEDHETQRELHPHRQDVRGDRPLLRRQRDDSRQREEGERDADLRAAACPVGDLRLQRAARGDVQQAAPGILAGRGAAETGLGAEDGASVAADRRLRERRRADRPYGYRRHAGRRLQRGNERRHPQDFRGALHPAASWRQAQLPLDGGADRPVRAALPVAGGGRSRVDPRHVRARLPRDPARETAAPVLRGAVGAGDLMERLPVLPLGQLVVYPHVVLPLALTDPKAVQLIDEIIQGEKRVLLAVVRSMGGIEAPEGAVMNTLPHQLYDVGTLGTIVRMLKLGDGSVRVMVQGLERARLANIAQGEKWLMADFEPLTENT